MKVITLFLFSVLFTTLQSFGQTSTDNKKDKQQLFKVKSLLEKHFSGTNLRSIQRNFEINQTQLNGYSFTSEINGLFPEKSKKLLSAKLNKVLKKTENTTLVGTLFFDKYLDSVLVNIEHKREDTVYNFVSMSGYSIPRGGFKNFSRRLHDFLKEQVSSNNLIKDSVSAIKSINLLVDKSGRFKQNDNNYLSKVLDIFFASEQRWNLSMVSGRHLSIVANFLIVHEYIFDGGFWPEENSCNKIYYNNNDFENYVNIYTIAHFDNENIPIFFSSELLQHSGKIIVSAVYDSLLNEYRMFAIHNGTLNNTSKLFTSIKNEALKNFSPNEFQYNRIYFMID